MINFIGKVAAAWLDFTLEKWEKKEKIVFLYLSFFLKKKDFEMTVSQCF